MSEMLLPHRLSVVSFVKSDKCEMSEMLLPPRLSVVKFVAFSSPVMLPIRSHHPCCAWGDPSAARVVSVFISPSVTAAVAARFAPRALLIALRRFASGMLTFAAEMGGAPASSITPHIRTNAALFVIKLLQIFIIICLLCPLFIAMCRGEGQLVWFHIVWASDSGNRTGGASVQGFYRLKRYYKLVDNVNSFFVSSADVVDGNVMRGMSKSI